VKYAWIKQYRNEFPVAAVCRVFGVSKSGFYGWLKRPESKRAKRTRAIHASVREVYEDSGQIYGSYKIADELKKYDHLETACRNTVADAMREMRLKSCVSRKFKPITTESDPSKKPAKNVLAQEFGAEAPNQKWVADITYLPVTGGGWVYLAVVLDLFSRKIVGWEMSERLTTPIVTN